MPRGQSLCGGSLARRVQRPVGIVHQAHEEDKASACKLNPKEPIHPRASSVGCDTAAQMTAAGAAHEGGTNHKSQSLTHGHRPNRCSRSNGALCLRKPELAKDWSGETEPAATNSIEEHRHYRQYLLQLAICNGETAKAGADDNA